HCMRPIGAAEEALEAMVRRLQSRTAFGKTIAEQGVWEERIANARIDIEMTRLLCLKAADMMDRAGNKAAQGEIAMIKVAAPIMALKVIDDAIQASGDYVLRRKPFGKLLPSAHAVDREYRLLSALHPLGFPVPRPFALCADAEVIGAIFYVMEVATGRPYANGALPEFDAATRRSMYEQLVDTLADLHN